MEHRAKAPTTKGPSETFTGDVWVDRIAPATATSPVNVVAVHFTPGARSAWHCHGNSGQTLYVIEGVGLVQTRGEPITTIRAGDSVYTPADEWHWHGATPEHFMTHLSITDGTAAWGEHVTDDEYHRPEAP